MLPAAPPHGCPRILTAIMARTPRVAIIGAGIVGCSLADELVVARLVGRDGRRAGTAVRDRRLHESHAPGIIFQTNASKTMAEFARYTVEKATSLTLDGRWCLNPVGSLELALTAGAPARAAPTPGLRRGVGPRRRGDRPRRGGPAVAAGRPRRILGAYHVPSDGLTDSVRVSRGAGAPRDGGRRPVPRRPHRDRHPHRRRSRPGRDHGSRRDPGGHRGLRRGHLGTADRGDGRHDRAAPAARPPATLDDGRCPRSSHRASRRIGRRSTRTSASRTATCTSASTPTGWASAAYGHVPMPIDAARPAPPTRGAGHAVGPGVHAGQLRRVVGVGGGADPRPPLARRPDRARASTASSRSRPTASR